MRKNSLLILTIFSTLLVLTGCATTRARQTAAVQPTASETNTQVTELQSQLQAKDQEIQELQYQLQNAQKNEKSTSNVSVSNKGSKSSIIRVNGVTVEDRPKALIKAGYDPGPADGHVGRKTRKAIKAFQRKHHLRADGIVGEQTWSYLK